MIGEAWKNRLSNRSLKRISTLELLPTNDIGCVDTLILECFAVF